MAASKVTYTGDGVQKQFNIPFPFIVIAHVSVFVNRTLQLIPMHYLVSGSTITFVDAPEVDDAIEVERHTSPTTILVDFHDGSTLGENELDTAYLHNFYLSQEYADSFNELINNAFLAIAGDFGIVETATDDIISALVAEMLNLDAAATLQQRVADIDDNAEAILTLGNGLQIQINTLAQGVAAVVYVQPDEPIPGQGGIPDPIVDGARWYDSDDNNHPYIYDQATTTWLSLEDPRIGQAAADITVLFVDVGDNTAAIVAEAVVRATDDSAIASELALIGVQNGGQTAFILDTSTVKIDTDGGDTFATRFSILSTADSDNSAAISTEQSARISADSVIATELHLLGVENPGQTAFILNTATVKIDTDGGDTFATRLSALATSDSQNAADIITEQSARISAVSANASLITILDAEVTTNAGDIASSSVSITANATAIVGNDTDIVDLYAHYGVSLNVNGYITGFIQNNDGETGSFVILADKFAIVDPTGDPSETEFIPFLVTGGVVSIQNLEVSGSLIVNGTIIGAALIPGTLGSTQIGANAITTTQLNANSVTAVKIQANTITADKLTISELAAITADIGSITAGDITLDTSGFIKGGQTAYNTGEGFFLGFDTADYKFSIGDGGVSNFLTWDGTSLVIRGNISIGSYTASETLMLSADTIRTTTTEQTYEIDVKKFEINRPGSIRFKVDVRLTNITGGLINVGNYRVMLDGVQKATGTVSSTSFSTRTHDITLLESSQFITLDIQSGLRNPSEPLAAPLQIRNCRLFADKSDGEAVIID